MGFDDATALGRRALVASVVGLVAVLYGCQDKATGGSGGLDEIASSVKFDEATYGVPASPRVAQRTASKIRKGGGRSHVGKPYKVKGKWYYPKDAPGYSATGLASWYGPNFHGRLTANGETYDMHHLSAAHKTFPLPSYAVVTNLENGSRVEVRVNDRGPFAAGREIDLSRKAAELLGIKSQGVGRVQVDYIGRAPLEGDDSAMLLASFTSGDPDERAQALASSADADPSSMQAAEIRTLANAPTPGTRPMRSLFQNQPSRTKDLIDSLSSFRSERTSNGSSKAVEALGTTGSPRAEEIYLGVVDRELMAKVKDVIGVGARASAEATSRPGLVSATVTAAPNVDKDRLLRRLWSAGFTDAFAIHD